MSVIFLVATVALCFSLIKAHGVGYIASGQKIKIKKTGSWPFSVGFLTVVNKKEGETMNSHGSLCWPKKNYSLTHIGA